MSWLYACTIYPLQFFFKYVYLACIRVTGSYGLGLIGLSLCAAVAFVPLGRMAKKSKWKEDHLQDVMRPQIEKIKAEYSGAERQEAIARLYKRYSYHPLMTLRSAIGILLQFPFLTAAYRMVQELTVLKGQSFWFIKDLSVPDGLWGGVNALPIIMTLINFASIATAPHMRGKDRIQAVVIALLFLWLLYGAPSALLIYWTCNNINYLVQNFVFHDKKSSDKEQSNSLQGIFSRDFSLGKNGRALLNVFFYVLFALMVSFFVFEVREVFDAFGHFSQGDKQYLNIACRRLYRCAVFICVFPMLFFFKRLLEQKFAALEVLIKAFLSCAGITALELFMHWYLVPIGVPNINGGKFTLLLWGVVVYCLLSCIIGVPYASLKQHLEKALTGQERKIYIGSVLAVILLLFVFCEAELYYSDPAFFSESLLKLQWEQAPYALGLFAFVLAAWFIMPHGIKLLVAVVALFAVIVIALNVFVFSGNYGSLDVTLLSAPQTLYSKYNWYKDACVLLITSLVLGIVLRFRLAKVVGKILGLACLSLFVFSGYVMYVTNSDNHNSIPTNPQELLPNFHERLWALSKKDKNVIIFFWDMFTGGHMQEILVKRPDLKHKLSGFVWYPDTMAVAVNTFLSTPSLLGGSNFTPSELNKNKNVSNVEKLHDAYSVLPNAFVDMGYDVVIAGAPWQNMRLMQAKIKSSNALILKCEKWEKEYVNYWLRRNANSQNDKTSVQKYLLMLSLFKISPSSFRAFIYDNAQWHGAANVVNTVKSSEAIAHLAPLQYMTDFFNTNAQKGTFKIFYSMLSHSSWHLPENSLIPVADPYPATSDQVHLVDGIIPEHLYTEQHMMSFLADFCDWLKKNDIYDNTRIIVVSDHDEADSAMLQTALGGKRLSMHLDYDLGKYKKYPGRAHALMMVKDFNEKGDLSISKRLVSTEDTASFAMMDFPKINCLLTRDELRLIQDDPQRIRMHFLGDFRPHHHDKNQMIVTAFQTQGSMFELDNWSYSDLYSGDLTFEHFDKESQSKCKNLEKHGKAHIDKIFIDKDGIHANGWAFLTDSLSAEENVYLLFENECKNYLFPATRCIRRDISKWQKNNLYEKSGFFLHLPSFYLPRGEYDVKVIINKEYITEKRFTFTKGKILKKGVSNV